MQEKWESLLGRATARNVAVTLFGVAVLVGVLGYGVRTQWQLNFGLLVEDLYANVFTVLIGVAITVVVVDTMGQRRADLDRKEALILQMGSPDHESAMEAVRLLNATRKGVWLRDGSAKCANLHQANLTGARLAKADLSEADLSEANLSKADLRGANLSGANLFRTDLRQAELGDSKLVGANLNFATLSKADLRGANLSGANLSRADLSWTELAGANLSEAKLYRADLSKADLTEADLSKADLSDANLSRAKLVGAKLFEARYIVNTVWPSEFPPPPEAKLVEGGQERPPSVGKC